MWLDVKDLSYNIPSRKILNEVERGGYRYLRVLDLNKVSDEEMKQQHKKEYKRRLRLILSPKLHGRNKIMAVNIGAVAVLWCGTGDLKWTTEKLKELDRKTRKLMTKVHVSSNHGRLEEFQPTLF